jgi:hypothetical protein
VYVIEILRTPYRYVGASLDIRRRVRHHLSRLAGRKHANADLQAQVVCAGDERVSAYAEALCDEASLASEEAKCIHRLRAEGLEVLNHIRPPKAHIRPRERSQAKSEALKRRWADPEARARLEQAINARRATPEYKASVSEQNRQAVLARWRKRGG